MKLAEAETQERYLEDGWMVMVHPDLEDSYSYVPVAAFDEVWQEQGWQKANLINPETGERVSEEDRVAQANAEAEKRAQEKPAKAEATGAVTPPPVAPEAPKEK